MNLEKHINTSFVMVLDKEEVGPVLRRKSTSEGEERGRTRV
jgi:hypothetical protein